MACMSDVVCYNLKSLERNIPTTRTEIDVIHHRDQRLEKCFLFSFSTPFSQRKVIIGATAAGV